MINKIRLLISVMLVTLLTWSAQAALQVFPTRVVLTDGQPSSQISVRHKGDKPANYKISLVFYEMKPDGSMVMIPEPKGLETSAIENLKYSPRKISLQPQEEQVVRILSSHISSLKEGEYRAHLYFESMDDVDDIPTPSAAGNTAQLFLKARMAVAVPIIVRHGETAHKIELSDASVITQADKNLAFKVHMKRAGNRFAYGDFKIVWQKPDGTTKDVGIVYGVSSYLDDRDVSYPLLVQDPEIAKSGTIRVEYHETAAEGGKLVAAAESKAQATDSKRAAASTTNLNEPVATESKTATDAHTEPPTPSATQ